MTYRTAELIRLYKLITKVDASDDNVLAILNRTFVMKALESGDVTYCYESIPSNLWAMIRQLQQMDDCPEELVELTEQSVINAEECRVNTNTIAEQDLLLDIVAAIGANYIAASDNAISNEIHSLDPGILVSTAYLRQKDPISPYWYRKLLGAIAHEVKSESVLPYKDKDFSIVTINDKISPPTVSAMKLTKKEHTKRSKKTSNGVLLEQR